MKLIRKYFSLLVFVVMLSGVLSGTGISSLCLAGGWDLDKGPNVSTIQGELVCVGCPQLIFLKAGNISFL